MSALIVLFGLVIVYWLVVGGRNLSAARCCHDGRSFKRLGSLVSGVVAAVVIGHLMERLILIGLLMAAFCQRVCRRLA